MFHSRIILCKSIGNVVVLPNNRNHALIVLATFVRHLANDNGQNIHKMFPSINNKNIHGERFLNMITDFRAKSY